MSTLNIALTEQNVIACLLKFPSLIEDCPDYFISNIGKSFYFSLKMIKEKNLEFTNNNIILLSSKISVLSEEKIETLKKLEVYEKDFKSYIEDLKESFIKEELRTKVIKNLVVAVETENKNLDKISLYLEEANQLIQSINKKEAVGVPLNEALEKYKSVLIERSKGEGFYPTGIGLIDNHNSLGFHPKYITTVFGKSGVGKTTTGISFLNAGINRFIPSVYDSLEMDMDILLDKLVSNRTGIPFDVLMKTKDSNGDSVVDFLIDSVEAERKKITLNRRVLLIDESSQSISDLDYEIPHWKKYMMVDYFVLHLDLATMLLDFQDSRGGSKASVYENAVDKLHVLARKHNIHIVAYAQSLRDDSSEKINKIEDIEKFRPKLSNIKNSSAFEERSRIILGLHREYYYAKRYLPNAPETDIMSDILEIQFLKNSLGNLPILNFLFEGEMSKIYPILKESSL